MLISLPVWKAKEVLRGSFDDSKPNDWCVVDTNTLEYKLYGHDLYKKLVNGGKLDAHEMRYKSNKGIIPSFLNGSIYITQATEKEFAKLYYNGDAIIELQVYHTRNYGDFIRFVSKGDIVFQYDWNTLESLRMFLFFGQKFGKLYRAVCMIDKGDEIVSEMLLIGLVFSESEYLGVEYAFGTFRGEININRQCFPVGAIGAKLALLQ